MFCPRAASPAETLVVADFTTQPCNPFDSLPIEVCVSLVSILLESKPVGVFDTNAYRFADGPTNRRISRE